MKLSLLINVKMPTIVGILTFISRINTTSKCFEQETIVLFLSILLSIRIENSCTVELSIKKFYNLKAR